MNEDIMALNASKFHLMCKLNNHKNIYVNKELLSFFGMVHIIHSIVKQFAYSTIIIQ